MDKKIIFSVILMYFLFTFISPIASSKDEIKQTQASGIFTPEISFEFVSNLTGEPINPSQTKQVTINVKFKLDMSSFEKWFLYKRRIGRLILFGSSYLFKIKGYPQSNLTIGISDSPTWCKTNIDSSGFNFNFGDIYKNKNSTVEKTINLDFIIKENATALDTGDLKVQANFTGFGGIASTSNSTTIPVTVAYVPNVQVETETEFAVSPLKNTTIPINITNNGNGDSTISILFISPENWTTSVDQNDFTLKVNETIQMNLTVNPPKEFTNQTINFSFIPKLGLYEGSPVVKSFDFINDGSLKESTGVSNEVLVVGIIVIIIIILVLFAFFFLGKKKQ